ncbi:MAG: mechanosensitive ion channel [bacterium]|nr:mechanosensitive ion channel [bacterium]
MKQTILRTITFCTVMLLILAPGSTRAQEKEIPPADTAAETAVTTETETAAAAAALAEEKNPLLPIKTDNPRDTMETFMESMNKYREGVETRDDKLISYIDRATRCFDLEGVSFLEQQQKGQESAILLKEVIDRVILIDYSKIPEKSEKPGESLLRWRLRGTEITIVRIEKGERAGEFLFSKDTTNRIREFYNKTKHLPYLKGSGGGAVFKESTFEKNVPNWSRSRLFFLFIWQWIGIFFSILIGLVIKFLVRFMVNLLQKFSQKREGRWFRAITDAFSGPVSLIAATAFWFLSLHILGLEGAVLTFLSIVLRITLSAVIIWLVYRLLNVVSDYLIELTKKTESTLDDQLVPLINRAMKIFIVIFGVLVAIQNLGVNVMSVLAGIGIGGFAFALAAKDTVANLFGSLMILFDSPFQVGDWIVVGKAEGTVEEIGFRSTRVRTFYNSIISIPNADLAMKEIDNMGRREYRRVRTVIGVTYDTPAEKLEAFLEGIKNVIKANTVTRKDYFHVVFNQYGPSSLDILLYFFLKVPDWSTELVERQNVFIEILRLAKELEVEFAFPTQSLYVESFPEKEASRTPWDKDVDSIKKVAKDFGPGGKEAHPSGQGIFIPPHTEK